jgi:hypothetical protein
MKRKEMVETLTNQLQELQVELLEIEKNFNSKKEQYLRVQGAVQALSELEDDT